MASQPILIVEGSGDRSAISYLVREVSRYQCFPASKPIMKQSIPRLDSQGELERFVRYALLRDDGDSVLILLDTDQHCAREVVQAWVPRIRDINPGKKVGIGFFVREFEAYFLACLDQIAEQYSDFGWDLTAWNDDDDHEAPRAAKERLAGFMAKHKGYKETVDQPRFVSALDWDRLRRTCRSFRHLESLLAWLAADDGDEVYPAIAE